MPKKKKGSSLSWEHAEKENTQSLQWLWEQAYEIFRHNYRFASHAEEGFGERYGYTKNTIQAAFASNPRTRHITERFLMDFMECHGLEVKKTILYEVGPDALEKKEVGDD